MMENTSLLNDNAYDMRILLITIDCKWMFSSFLQQNASQRWSLWSFTGKMSIRVMMGPSVGCVHFQMVKTNYSESSMDTF